MNDYLNACDNIKKIKLSNKLKQLNALQILEDEEYIKNGAIEICYMCENDDFDYHFIKSNEESIKSFFNELKMKYSLKNSDFYIDFCLNILKKQNIVNELVRGNHLCIITCKQCCSVLKIGNYILFNELPISIEAFEEWGLIRLNGKLGMLHDGKNTFSWNICPDCGDIIYSVLRFDGQEKHQCRSCYKMFPYTSNLNELKKYL